MMGTNQNCLTKIAHYVHRVHLVYFATDRELSTSDFAVHKIRIGTWILKTAPVLQIIALIF
jgi:hypothetical protein